MLLVATILLAVFYVLDWYLFHIDENYPPKPDPTPDSRLRIEGWMNVALIVAVALAVLTSGVWKPGVKVTFANIDIELQNVVRDVALLLIAGVSWMLTPIETRENNGFNWAPIVEVAKLFAGIFVTIIPAIAILKAGTGGALAPVVASSQTPKGNPTMPCTSG